MRKLSAQMFSRFPRSTDRLAPAVVWERDDQMSGPGTGEMAVLVGGSVAVKSVETMRGNEPSRLRLIESYRVSRRPHCLGAAARDDAPTPGAKKRSRRGDVR